MTYPSDDRKDRDNDPIFMNVLPERLNSLSASELADELELALDYMTEETYDPTIVSAYLDAVDSKAPMPEYPDADAAYAELCKRTASAAAVQQPKPEPIQPRRIMRHSIRVGLAAAVVIVCMFGGMIVVQASGVDVFGAIARWTESVFTFNNSDLRGTDNHPSYNESIPDEYKELQAVLQERRLPLYVPAIPEDFVVDESTLYIYPDDEGIRFSVLYIREDDYINYTVIERKINVNSYYEKDSDKVESFEFGGALYYVFQNEGDTVIAWSIDEFEYALSSNLSSDFLKEILQSEN